MTPVGLTSLMVASTRGRQALTKARWSTSATLLAILLAELGLAVTLVLAVLAAGFFAYAALEVLREDMRWRQRRYW